MFLIFWAESLVPGGEYLSVSARSWLQTFCFCSLPHCSNAILSVIAWQILYIIQPALRKSMFIWCNSTKERARCKVCSLQGITIPNIVLLISQKFLIYHCLATYRRFITHRRHKPNFKKKKICCKHNSKLGWASFYSALQGSARKIDFFKTTFCRFRRKAAGWRPEKC